MTSGAGVSSCDAYVCESSRVRVSSSWFKDELSDKDYELANYVQVAENQDEIRQNVKHVTLIKNDDKRCEVAITSRNDDYALEWRSITVHSSSRIVEIYTDNRKNYINTAKFKAKVANNQYVCAYSTSQPITCTSLNLKFLSLDHPTHKQNKLDIYNIIIIGTMKQQVKKEAAMADTTSSLVNELIMNPSILMSMMGGLKIPPLASDPIGSTLQASPIMKESTSFPSVKELQQMLSESERSTISTRENTSPSLPPSSVPLQNEKSITPSSSSSIDPQKSYIMQCIKEFAQSDDMKNILYRHVDERMSYWEKRILDQVNNNNNQK